MSAFNTLWEKSLSYLEEDLQMFQFNVWIKDLKPVTEQDDVYYFEVSSPMHKNLMMEKYQEKIESTLKIAYEEIYGLTQPHLRLQFVTPDETLDLTGVEKEPAPEVPRHSTLNKNHTFDTFVVGESNKFANAAAVAVASSPGHAYNPLFLYGGVGLGKTHLMHAIGNKILDKQPDLSIVYVTSEAFTNELINMIALTNNNANIDMREQFRNKYRKIDVLMIDDIQFIAGKDKTQDEFFHTFNALHELNKQIIISSDRPPSEMEQLDERMRSRFEWGIVADIKKPDYETRVAILIRKAQALCVGDMLPIRDEAFHYIAKQQDTNIRTLEGALQRVLMYAELHKDLLQLKEIDQHLAERALDGYFKVRTRSISPKIVVSAVCRYYDVSEDDLRGQKRSRSISFPRQVAMYIMRECTDMTFDKIAVYFGKNDHTTIMHALKKISGLMKSDASIKREVEDIIANIKG